MAFTSGRTTYRVRDTRRIVGPNPLIGVSTHDRAQLEAAILSGASYLGVGPVFPSATKEFSEPELAGLAFVQTAAETTRLPWFAIGGISEQNVQRAPRRGRIANCRERGRGQGGPTQRAAARLKAILNGEEVAEDRFSEDRDE